MKTDVKRRVVRGQEIVRRRKRFFYTHMEDSVHPDERSSSES